MYERHVYAISKWRCRQTVKPDNHQDSCKRIATGLTKPSKVFGNLFFSFRVNIWTARFFYIMWVYLYERMNTLQTVIWGQKKKKKSEWHLKFFLSLHSHKLFSYININSARKTKLFSLAINPEVEFEWKIFKPFLKKKKIRRERRVPYKFKNRDLLFNFRMGSREIKSFERS